MAKRRCRHCPQLIPTTAYKGMCPTCRRTADQERGTTTQRGYGAQHQAERVRIQADLDAGNTILCCRCNQPILPGQPWSPDHTGDRTGYLGASHQTCNLSAAGRASHNH